MADAARAVGKHPLPISPSRPRFALEVLCKVRLAPKLKSQLVSSPISPEQSPCDLLQISIATAEVAEQQREDYPETYAVDREKESRVC